LERTSSALGFEVPANFLFFTGVVLLLLVGIHLSVALTALENRVQRLAEELALVAEKTKDHP
jgi:succinate dehydrogenase hydrophobic anchor subunit